MKNKIIPEEQLILIYEKNNDVINPEQINNQAYLGIPKLQDLLKKISKENYTDSLLEIINQEKLQTKIYQETHNYFGKSHQNRSKSTLPQLVTINLLINSKNWNKKTTLLSKYNTNLFKNVNEQSFDFEKTRLENTNKSVNLTHIEALNHSYIKNTSPTENLSRKKKNNNLLDSDDSNNEDGTSSDKKGGNINFR